MEHRDVGIIKNKTLRGQVLRTLAMFYPTPVLVRQMRTALISDGIYSPAEMPKILKYLEDKKYIEIRTENIYELRDEDQLTLTAKGVDLIEGTIKDAGVDL